MLTIWKYPLPVEDHFSLELPQFSGILSVQAQDGVPTLWALVDPVRPPVLRQFRFFGTGHPVPAVLDGMGNTVALDRLKYVATVQVGPFVWHLFECV